MISSPRFFLVLSLSCTSLLACGGDKNSDKDTSNMSATGDQNSTGNDAGGDGLMSCAQGLEPLDMMPSAPPEYTCNESPSSTYPDSDNVCRNKADCALIEESNKLKATAMRQIAKNCALSCQGTEGGCDALAKCNDTCIRLETMKNLKSTLSQGCGECYTFVAVCGLEKCLSQCADDADSLDCVECSFKSGCRVPFERCSGLDRK